MVVAGRDVIVSDAGALAASDTHSDSGTAQPGYLAGNVAKQRSVWTCCCCCFIKPVKPARSMYDYPATDYYALPDTDGSGCNYCSTAGFLLDLFMPSGHDTEARCTLYSVPISGEVRLHGQG